MLMDTHPSDINKTLIPLICNNFYENILSSKSVQDNLIYTIGLLLKYEINDFNENKKVEKFLNINSTCGYMLYELRTKNDSQIFIKKVIEEAVSKIDEYPYNLCFDIKKINEDITNKFTDIKHEKIDNLIFNFSEKDIINDIVKKKLGNSFNKDKKIDEFNNKYMKDLNLDFNKNDNEILNYYYNLITKSKKISLEQINNYLKETINEYNYKNEILLFYINDFYITTHFIDTFLKNLMSDLSIIPYSIKILCKTIYILIKKKFPNFPKIKCYAFISRFFFCNLFWPVLQDSSFGALIENYIIPQNTMNNLKIIIDIFVNFIMGKLYFDNENIYLSPFNRFFIEKMPDFINFIDNLINVNIPKYLENICNDNNDYKFDIYNENHEDGFFERTICFTLEDFQDIIIHIQKNKTKIKTENNKKFLDCFDKILDNSTANVITKIQKDEKKNNKLYYFLLTDRLYLNDKIKKLFTFEQKSIFFQINEIEKPKTDEDKNKNLVIKIKNFLFAILFKFIVLSKDYFSEDSLMNIYDILKELLNKSTIPNFIVENEIPTEWYVKSVLENLPKLPKEYTEGNCQKLIKEMINEISLSIKEIDLETLTSIKSKLSKTSIENPINIIKNIDLNKKVESIIHSDIVEVGLSFHYDGNNTIFNIVQEKSILDFNVIDDENSLISVEAKVFKTISEFIKSFPDFTIYQTKQDIDILEFQNKLKVPDQLFIYLKIIINNIQKSYKFSKEELSEIRDKIYDYIMLRLYDKLFPLEPSDEENKNYKNTIIYSWAEPKHFIKDKADSTYNSFLPDIIKYLKLFIKEKSPRKKIENVVNVFNAIERVIKFNGLTGLLGADDYMSILSYSYIKAQPYRMLSSIRYSMLYNPRNIKGSESLLTQLLGSCKFVTKLSFNSLFNITKEEYDEKMSKSFQIL